MTVRPSQHGNADVVPLASWTEALDRRPEEIKVVVELTA
jgi:hypothetical protein